MNSDRIPCIDSIEELAQFWDSHDLTDFEEGLEEVGESVFERETVVRVHLPPKEAGSVEEIARSQGVDSADLIRQWVLEKVHSV